MKAIFLFSFLMLPFFDAALASECPIGEHWVDAHFRNGYVRYNGVAVSSTQVRGHCRSNPRGYEKWNQRLSNSRPKIWGYKIEKTKKWNTEDLERVYDIISVLPQQLLELKEVNIHRMDKSAHSGNPATANYNDIVLYDLAFRHKDSLEQILFHELSHVFYEELSRETKDDFANVAGWIKDKGVWVPRKDKVLIEEDSMVSVEEDFANQIEHYLIKGDSLKKNSPTIYEWIKKKFGDEFKIQEKK